MKVGNMDDKTPIYMVIIVAIVAVIGLVVVLTHNSPSASPATEDSSNVMTGNVVIDTNTGNGLNSFGKLFFLIFLVGIAAYMYFRKPE
jgi:hypothetical protein